MPTYTGYYPGARQTQVAKEYLDRRYIEDHARVEDERLNRSRAWLECYHAKRNPPAAPAQPRKPDGQEIIESQCGEQERVGDAASEREDERQTEEAAEIAADLNDPIPF